MFQILATGLVAQTGRKSVVGMLAGSGMQVAVSFHAACRFFSEGTWDVDRVGLRVARLIVEKLVPVGAPVLVAVDDTLVQRWGRKVFAALWTHDGSSKVKGAVARGNRWVVAGIVVDLPFCARPVCLPVLFRLWLGKGAASPVRLAGQMLEVLAGSLRTGRFTGWGTRRITARNCRGRWPPSPPGCRATPCSTAMRRGAPGAEGGPGPRESGWAPLPTWLDPAGGALSRSTGTGGGRKSTSWRLPHCGTAVSARPGAGWCW